MAGAGRNIAGAIGLAAIGLTATVACSPATPQKYTFPRAHYEWCFKQYSSYRAQDNTYLDEEGERVPCVSPYIRR